uniref:Putative kunitz-type peptidase inhibitor n=1 Tax=Amblyomma americanum TaxID=6943 RepID=A0A0C9RXD5_AMBAM
MRILNAITASYSLVALLLTVSQSDQGTEAPSKDDRCGHGRPNLTKEEIKGEVSFRFFNHNKSCERFMVTKDEKNGFKRLHDCVTKCGTGQGSPVCAAKRLKCKKDDGIYDCDTVYYYDLKEMRCKAFRGKVFGYNGYNTFLFNDTCDDYCGGFSRKDVRGTRRPQK